MWNNEQGLGGVNYKTLNAEKSQLNPGKMLEYFQLSNDFHSPSEVKNPLCPIIYVSPYFSSFVLLYPYAKEA